MSRSRRHTPITGTTTARSDKWFKQLSSRRARHRNKIRVNQGLDPVHPYLLTNPYLSMKDGKTHWWPSTLKQYRFLEPDEFAKLMRK